MICWQIRAEKAVRTGRGSQFLCFCSTKGLAELGIEPAIGRGRDSDNTALAETIDGLFTANVIHRPGPWRRPEAAEYARREWVDRFNNRRLLEPFGNIPPGETEANVHAALATEPMAA